MSIELLLGLRRPLWNVLGGWRTLEITRKSVVECNFDVVIELATDLFKSKPFRLYPSSAMFFE